MNLKVIIWTQSCSPLVEVVEVVPDAEIKTGKDHNSRSSVPYQKTQNLASFCCEY